MIKGYYKQVAEFLSGFVTMPDGSPVPPDVVTIKEIIDALICSDFCTKEDMKRSALKHCNLILRDELFPEKTMIVEQYPATVQSCRFCGGRLSEVRSHNGARYRHCFSCHFEWRCEDD